MSCFNISLWLCLWLVLLFGSVLKDLGELVVVEHPLGNGGLLVHLVYLVVREPVPDGGQQLPQSVLVQETDIVLVKTSKRVLDDILRVSSLVTILHPSSDD